MPPAKKPATGKQQTEDDDVFDPNIPGDEDDERDLEVDKDYEQRGDSSRPRVEAEEAEGGDFVHKGAPHPHLHTPGYPGHRHKDGIIDHDPDEMYMSGGEELFNPVRHDGDVEQAEGLEQDRKDAEFETPENVGAQVVDYLHSKGFVSTIPDQAVEPNMPGGVVVSMKRNHRTIVMTIAYGD